MNLRSVAATLLASITLSAYAQTEEELSARSRIDFDAPGAQVYVPKSTISFGFRVMSSGAKVNFGNLGTVNLRSIAPVSDGSATRIYDNGSVNRDELRNNEIALDANGNFIRDANGNFVQSSTPGGRYQTTTTANDVTRVTGDFLSYTPGQTRTWTYVTDAQIVGQHVAMTNYGALSEGATAMEEQGISPGVELQLARALGKGGKRFEWSITAGLAINDINAKTGGTVTSTLVTHTDYFSIIGGAAPTGQRGGPSFVNLVDAEGNLVTANGLETTVPLNDVQESGMSTDTRVAGGASVQGNWQIKGAYMLLRLGPTLRTQLSENFGLSASIGVAGAYAGSRYSVVELLEVPDVAEPVTTFEESSVAKMLTGFYADVNVDWTANERTGLFAGLTMQQFGNYDQSVGGRTAKIDFGNSVGLRGGISIKF